MLRRLFERCVHLVPWDLFLCRRPTVPKPHYRPLYGESLEHRWVLSLDLPGLQLVDPTVDHFDRQIIYLDFDGEENVTYRGPVTVGPFDVPAFQAPRTLAGQEADIISEVVR